MARLYSLARKAAAAIAIGVLLTGCLVPESIDTSIVLEGHEYDMRVETRLADPRVVKAVADGHALTEQEEDRMRAGGRFNLVVNLTGELDASDGTIEVSTPELPDHTRADSISSA